MRALRILPLAALIVSLGVAVDAPAAHADDPVPYTCVAVDDQRAVCVWVTEGDPENDEFPAANACVYDETLSLVMWWYDPLGQVACVNGHTWDYLGTPGACVGIGDENFPIACIGRDIDKDYDNDGQVDETLHCLIWVAGVCQGFHD